MFAQYEQISGQKVNYGKSSIIFGKSIPEEARSQFHQILKIHTLGGGGKYLGLPEQFSRSKVSDFQGVVSIVKNQISPWYNQFLLSAGKEVLIKSVLQAKPVYPMSCFLLPKSVCDDINSQLSGFWWGRNDGKRKFSWISWQRLCLPKNEGGMGFCDLHGFNVALLAKQAWKIEQNPTSLLSRIYKGRYYNSSTFLQSTSLTSSSYGWKSIQVGKDLLKKGLVMQIGNGQNTNVWNDQWLQTSLPRKLISPCLYPNMKVSELINQSSASWNEAILEELFVPEDIIEIKKIRLSRFNQCDRYVWPFTSDCKYSVKSGYWTNTHVFSEDDPIEPPPGSFQLKNQIWDLEILPKIQHFFWKAVTGALATFAQLCSRGININPICQRCGLEEETINHVLFLCPHALATWRCSGLPLNGIQSHDLERNIAELFFLLHRRDTPSAVSKLTFWLLWYIWKSRNEFLLAQRNVHPMEDVKRAVEGNVEWNSNFVSAKANGGRQVRNSKWEPPPLGWLKCNFDSSFRKETMTAGIGWIVRDENGHFLKAGMVIQENVTSPLQAEALAFLYALQQVWINGWRRVWFEGDSSELARIINTMEQDHVSLGNILYDIRHWMSKLTWCSLESVHREHNMAADVLSKNIMRLNVSVVVLNSPPCWLVNYLYWPYTV